MTQEKDQLPLQKEMPVEGQGILLGFEPPVLTVKDGETAVVPLAFLAQQENIVTTVQISR